MLLAPQGRSFSRKRMGLNRWKRFTRKPSPKRVEKASEFAVSNAFFTRNSDLPRSPWGQITDLKTSEQIEDHDEIYAEGAGQ
ncbi:CCDC191 isoform 2 [Pan troglodytes]|uniref:CCDC191 isoform 2 n=1 Tax=Pan troglodytes TaxID=9598 RepID=A0A2J8M378_PANTR|nr:CCDC191 isoform 2 [Pan troglodytes]